MNVLTPPSLIEPPHRVMLGSGRWITIRAIESHDVEGLSSFYRQLSPDARHARFLSASSGLAVKAAQHFAQVDHVVEEGLVAVLHEAGPADGVIVGHLCLEPNEDGEEVGVAVADEFRGHGIGTALMKEAVAWATRRGRSRLTADLYPTNTPMRRLMLAAGRPVMIDRIRAGVEEITLAL